MTFLCQHKLKYKITAIIVAIFVTASCLFDKPINTSALATPDFVSRRDINYAGNDGEKLYLTHKRNEPDINATYWVENSALTRNATFYISINARFTNSESWGVRLRNVSCKVDGKVVTGDLVFRFFKTSGVAQIGDVTVNQEKWASFDNICDNQWHNIIVKSDTKSISVWIDGNQAKGTYFAANVTEMKSNYSCPGVFMGGYNDGELKNLKVWNNGGSENPVMPADRVVRAITALPNPSNIKVSDADAVGNVSEAYIALSSEEKKYVNNYSRFQQAEMALNSLKNSFELWVSGTETGKFEDVLGESGIVHDKGDTEGKYFLEGEMSRNSTYYIQFAAKFDFLFSFDLYLRNAEYEIDGKKITGNTNIRFFRSSAAVVDSKQNRISSFINYPDIGSGTHVFTLKVEPYNLTVWIDGVKYEFSQYLMCTDLKDEFSSVENYNNISTVTGFCLGSSEEYGAYGKIFDIRVFNDKNTLSYGENRYSSGDDARISIFKLPEYNQITLDDKPNVQKARELVSKLAEEDLKYVTNIDKLEKLERAIQFIEETGEYAYMFLRDEMPLIKKDDKNLISISDITIPAEHNNYISYNKLTHDLVCTSPNEYIEVPFTTPELLSAEDTYVIKFSYTPYEYFYETETSAWMGLRVYFSGYQVGGNGQKYLNRTELAFMTDDIGIISTVNGTTGACDYFGGYKIELDKTYDVVLLCAQGKMKLWINNMPVAYYDTIPEFGPYISFQFSRARCDVKNIQIYNYKDETPLAQENVKDAMHLMVDDLLYNMDGIELIDKLNLKKYFVAGSIAFSFVMLSAVIMLLIRRKRKH